MAEEEPRVPVTSINELDIMKVEVENGSGELKQGIHCVVNEDIVLGPETAAPPPPPCKTQVKEPNEDIGSEVTDSIVSSGENENSWSLKEKVHGCDSHKAGLRNSNQLNSGEITSTSSGSSSMESSSDGDSRNGSTSLGVPTSHVTLDIPKHASSTGIRKITFKFSKSKMECDIRLSTSRAQSVSDVYRNGESHDHFNQQPGLYSSSYPVSHNMEMKMSKKIVADGYPTNVKKLLSTGILEGARVTYKTASGDREIPGIIRGCGYCCGCSSCNYTHILSAYEFEQHAGGAKTRHPNNHIHLENGRPIYSIIEELKTAPPGILEDVVKQMVGPSVNERSFCAWKDGRHQYDDMVGFEKCEESPLLSRSHLSFRVKGRKSQHGPKQQAYMKELSEESRNLTKRSSSTFSKLNVPQKKSCISETKKRDNDLHRLLFKPNGLPEGARLSYCVKGKEVLSGYKQGNGIVCSHCDCEVSPSQFEAHAGWGARRQPYRHIYTSEGHMLHDIATQLSKGQLCIAGPSDDMCAVCGGEGDLMFCAECPRAYHKGCLTSEVVMNEKKDGCRPSDGKWCCPDCYNRKDAPDDLSDNAKRIIVRLTREIVRPEYGSGGCIMCSVKDFSPENFDDHTVIICDQCEKEYHVGCLRENNICDLKELPSGKWFCCLDCGKIHAALQELVTKGAEMLPKSVVGATMRKCLEKGFGGIAENDMQWQILCGKGHPFIHRQLLSGAVAIFREGFNPIVSRSGRDLIPVMVYGRNIFDQEFAGMYTVVLFVKSVVVSAALLRVFGCEVAELPLVATTKENRGKGYFQALLSCIEGLLCSLNVQTLVLPASGEAKSIWTNKFGFTSMKRERLLNYTKYYQLTEFRGTSWLEKILEHAED